MVDNNVEGSGTYGIDTPTITLVSRISAGNYQEQEINISTNENQVTLDDSKLAAIKVFNCNDKQSAFKVINDEPFCNLINNSSHLFLIIIQVDRSFEIGVPDFSSFHSKITNSRPIIVQFQSHDASTYIIYYRKPFESFVLCDNKEAESIDDLTRIMVDIDKIFDLELLLSMLRAGHGGNYSGDLLGCSLDTAARFETWRYIDYAACCKDSLSLRLLLFLADWKLYSKNDSGKRVIEIATEFGDKHSLSAILNLSLKSDSHEVTPDKKQLLYLEDINGNTPFLVALEKGGIDTMKFLIDLGCVNEDEYQTAVDLVWESKNYDKLVVLLEKDAPFPTGFVMNFTHGALEEIVSMRNSLHQAITDNDEESVSSFIMKHPHIKKGFNVENKVALSTALECKKYFMYALLRYNRFLKDKHVSDFLDFLPAADKSELKIENAKFFRKIDTSHILYLLSKSRLHCQKPKTDLPDDKIKQKSKSEPHCQEPETDFPDDKIKQKSKSEPHCQEPETDLPDDKIKQKSKSEPHCQEPETDFPEDRIKQLYESLNKIPRISVVLRVIEHAQALEIIYDFNRNSIVDMNPVQPKNTRGCCEFKNCRIYIGAKQLNDSQLLATLAHEFTHLAMQIRYNNDCNPYDSLDSRKKESFTAILEKYKEDSNADEIIKMAFTVYGGTPSVLPSELIVRVNHLLALYHPESSNKLEEAKELVDWYDNNVDVDLTKFIEDPNLYKNEIKILQFNVQNKILRSIESLSEQIKINSSLRLSTTLSIIKCENSTLPLLHIYQTLLGTMHSAQIIKNVIIEESSRLTDGNMSLEICPPIRSVNTLWVIIDCTKSDKVDHVASVVDRLTFRNRVVVLVQEDQVQQLNFASPLIGVNCRPKYNFENLTKESQEYLLENSIVRFQNNKINLKDIVRIDSQIANYLPLEVLLQGTLNINCSDNYPENYFMKRYFVQYILLNRRKLKETNDDNNAIFLSTCSRCESKQFARYETTENVHCYKWRPTFLPRTNGNVDGDLTRRDTKVWAWGKSKGSISALRKSMDASRPLIMDIDQLLVDAEVRKIVLISDPVGMGKTSLAIHTGKYLKDKNRANWVSVILLHEHATTFQNFLNFTIDSPEGAINFLADEILKLSSSFEKDLLKYSCLEEGSLMKVALFFDGLDEISPTYYQLVVGLIKQLENTAIEQIWITTRPHLTPRLEDVFNTVHCELEPLIISQQVTFLTESWQYNLEKKLDGKKIEEFAKALVAATSKSLSRNSSLVGTLLMLNSLVEVYCEKAVAFCEGKDTLDFCENLQMHDILQMLIDKRSAIFIQDKSKLNISVVAAREVGETLCAYALEAHQIWALHVLFPDDENFNNLAKMLLRKNNDEKLSRMGLMTVRGGKIVFFHHAFVEYFAAQYFVIELKDKNEISPLTRSLLLDKVFVLDGHNIIRQLLDAMIDFSPANKLVLVGLTKPEGIMLGFVREGLWNLAKYFLELIEDDKEALRRILNKRQIWRIAFESGCDENVEIFCKRAQLLRIDGYLLPTWVEACAGGNMKIIMRIQEMQFLHEPSNVLKTFLKIGWITALRSGQLEVLEKLFSLMVNNYQMMAKTILKKATSWSAAVAALDRKVFEKLRCWNEDYKLNNVELKEMNKSIWDEAFEWSYVQIFETLWTWADKFNLDSEDRRMLVGDISLWRKAAEEQNILLLSKLVTWGYAIQLNFNILKDFMISKLAWSVNNRKWHVTLFGLVRAFNLNVQDFGILFESMYYSREYVEFENLVSLARDLNIDQHALKDAILSVWRYACYDHKPGLLGNVWEWIANFNTEEKKEILLDSLAWQLAMVVNCLEVQKQLWRMCREVGLERDEFESTLKLVWRMSAEMNKELFMKLIWNEGTRNIIIKFRNKSSTWENIILSKGERSTRAYVHERYKLSGGELTENDWWRYEYLDRCQVPVEHWRGRENRRYDMQEIGEMETSQLIIDIYNELFIEDRWLFPRRSDFDWDTVPFYSDILDYGKLITLLRSNLIDGATKKSLGLRFMQLALTEFYPDHFNVISEMVGATTEEIAATFKNAWMEPRKDRVLFSVWHNRRRRDVDINLLTDINLWRDLSKHGCYDLMGYIRPIINSAESSGLSHVLTDETSWKLAAENGHISVLRRFWEWYHEANLEEENLKNILVIVLEESIFKGHFDILKFIVEWKNSLSVEWKISTENLTALMKWKGANSLIFLFDCCEGEDDFNACLEFFEKY